MLNGVLGEYVHGISTRDLNVAVFKGDIVLKGMRLKVEALNALGLPFRVLSGVVGKLTLQIPWRALGKQAVVVRIEELYVVAGFAEPGRRAHRRGAHRSVGSGAGCSQATPCRRGRDQLARRLRRLRRVVHPRIRLRLKRRMVGGHARHHPRQPRGDDISDPSSTRRRPLRA